MYTFKQRLRFILLGVLYALVFGIILAAIVLAVLWISAVITLMVEGAQLEAIFGLVFLLLVAQCIVMCCWVSIKSAKNKQEHDLNHRKNRREQEQNENE
jgi:predicted tellurium resistance membrane protein TerC